MRKLAESDTTRGPKDPERRGLLSAALAAAGAVGFFDALPAGAGEIPRDEAARVLDRGEAFPEGNALERMGAELARALDKPVEERKWVMVIDLQKCIGCKACTVSCVAENNLPPGVVYRPVVEQETGIYPNVRERFTPRPCMHCDDPPCTPVCPVSATYKRPDGIVAVDYDACIGCHYCLVACPYNARTADPGMFYGEGTPQVMAYETRRRSAPAA